MARVQAVFFTHHIPTGGFFQGRLFAVDVIVTRYRHGYQFGGFLEGVLGKMGVSLGGGYVGVAEQLLDFVEAAAVVDEI